MTLTPDEVTRFVRAISITAVWCGFLGAFANAALFKLLEVGMQCLRKRGARAPFADRAARLEQLRGRMFRGLCRIQERRQREAARKG